MYERRREAVQCVEGIRVKLEDLEEGAGDGESFDDRDDEGEVLPASTGQSPPPPSTAEPQQQCWPQRAVVPRLTNCSRKSIQSSIFIFVIFSQY